MRGAKPDNGSPWEMVKPVTTLAPGTSAPCLSSTAPRLRFMDGRAPTRHRHTHDLFVEVFDPNIEIKGTEHLRHPRGLGLVCCAGA